MADALLSLVEALAAGRIEVIDLTQPGPLAVGMKVDVYFRLEGP